MSLPGGIGTQNLNVYVRNLFGLSPGEERYAKGVETYLYLFHFTHYEIGARPVPFPERSFLRIFNVGKLLWWRGRGMLPIDNAQRASPDATGNK